MANKQLMLPANRAFNSNGLAVPFAKAYLYVSGTLTPASFYADSSLATSLGSALTATGGGRFANAYQDEATAFRLILKDADGAELDDIDPFYFGATNVTAPGPTLASGSFTPTLTAVANCSALSVGRAHYLQIGNVVHVAMNLTMTLTTSATSTSVGISLPVARDLGVTSDVIGSCRVVSSTNQVGGYVNGDTSNDRAQATLTPSSTSGSSLIVSATFSYMTA